MAQTRLLIAVPSLNRPYVIGQKLVRWLSRIGELNDDELQIDWVVCVEPAQVLHYRLAVKPPHLITSSDGCKMSGQITRMGQYAMENGYDFVMKCDDDMRFSAPGLTKFAQAHVALRNALVDFVRSCRLHPEIDGCGFIRYRDHRNNKENLRFTHSQKQWTVAYVTRPQHMRLPPEATALDDTYVPLQIVRGGGLALTYGRVVQVSSPGDGEGGFQSYDRVKLEEECFAKTKPLFPCLRLVKHTVKDTGKEYMAIISDSLAGQKLTRNDPLNADHPADKP